MRRALGRPRSAALVLLALAACTGGGGGPGRLEVENEMALRSLLGMLESGETADVAGLFHPDAVYDDFANQQQYQGLEEIAGYLAQGSRWADGVSVTLTGLHVWPGGGVAEWIFSGIQDRPMGTLVPLATGREVVLNGVTVIEVESGRIRRAADYMDVLPLLLQLGAEVRMPGGGVLRRDAQPPEPDPQPQPEERP